ncbi:MAG: anti-phage dCTP deaminase [Gammaproteobacteria bacterium]|nr:anti-phage dCTP deaminase [Gammaproteobacteria bacterium]MDH5799648.1 anti-phage dCTP deaminase [Gammaproteobacteria bacterium]
MPKIKKQRRRSEDTSKNELFIGVIGAVGTDLKNVCSRLSKELKAVGYNPEIIRLSNTIVQFGKTSPEVGKLVNADLAHEEERIKNLMDAGDLIRRKIGDSSAVAQLALSAIAEKRKEIGCELEEPCYGTAYILNSLKHPDEVEMLRDLYGKSFFLISVYSPKSNRIDKLAKNIAKSHHWGVNASFNEIAKKLIDRDEKGEDQQYGQNVRDAFPLADVFVAEDHQNDEIKRFIELLFGHPFITPTTDEYSMFHAHAAALRSADLARQVGAVIATNEAEIISSGCNEVPKAGGGKVWEDMIEHKKDYRDFQLGHDANTLMKHQVITEIIGQLNASDLLKSKKTGDEINSLAENVLSKDGILKDSRIASIIEYGRIVHAEMSAIMESARRGLPIKGATLYCTTFPCHMCARHIIDAGIKRVVYIEPYPKSMAKQLYKRSVCVDDDDADTDAVRFESFVGIAPRKYFELFQMTKRKDKFGYKLDWKPETSKLRISERFPIYLDIESTLIENFFAKAEKSLISSTS